MFIEKYKVTDAQITIVGELLDGDSHHGTQLICLNGTVLATIDVDKSGHVSRGKVQIKDKDLYKSLKSYSAADSTLTIELDRLDQLKFQIDSFTRVKRLNRNTYRKF